MLTVTALVLPAIPFFGLVIWGAYYYAEWRRCQRGSEKMEPARKLRGSLLLVLLLCLFVLSFAVYDVVQPANATALTTEAAITLSVPESGMAPLRVFADSLATRHQDQPTDGSVPVATDTVDYRSLRFQWHFGDPDGSRNEQSGGNMCAAYVYELPDGAEPVTRTITLTVTDPRTGAGFIDRKTITVRPFEGTTFYFDAEIGDDRRTPKEAQNPETPWKTVRQAELAIRAHRAGAVRVLFRRGQRFVVDKGMTFENVSGAPLILWGAHGEGARPLLDARGIGDRNLFQLNGRCHNWVFQDLNIEKAGHPILEPGAGGDVWDMNGDVEANTASRNMLFLRCKASGGGATVTTYRTVHDRETHEQQFRDITIADCDFRNASSMILYMGGERVAIVGSVLKANGSQHLLRFWYLGRAVILDNQCEDVCLDQSQGKLRSLLRILAVPKKNYAHALPTRHVIVSGNVFQMGSGTQCFDIASGSDDIDTNGRTHHILFEKNRLIPSITAPRNPKAYWDLVADNITIRNNLIHGALFDESAYVVRCVDYFTASGGKVDAPKPHNIWVLGNTVYAPHTAGKKLQLVSIVARDGGTGFQASDAEVTGNLVVRNNIAVGSAATRTGEILRVYSKDNRMVQDGQVSEDHNLLYPAGRGRNWLVTQDSGSLSLENWQGDPFQQGIGSRYVDAQLVAPELGTQTITIAKSADFKVGDRVYGLRSGASGVIESMKKNRITLRGIWSGRPFPAKDHPEFDGKDGLYNIDRGSRATVVSASEVGAGDDFSVAPGSPAKCAGITDPRLFEDFHGRPRPGSFTRSGKPTIGAIEP